MASRGDGQSRGRLDATGDREVVFCHACSNEWYRDQHGLICPQCEGDIIEIVSPENDPREPLHDPPPSSPPPDRSQQRQGAYDSDPDEADIEEHLQGQDGFHYHRNTRTGQQGQHHDPEMEPVLNRFLDMISGFGGGGRMPHVHGHNGNLDEAMSDNAGDGQNTDSDQGRAHHPHHHHHHHHVHRRQHGFATSNLGPNATVHRVVSNIGGGGGTASFTIYTRTAVPRTGDDGMWGDQGFQQHFNNILENMGPPRGAQQDQDSDSNIGGGGPAMGPGPGDFIASLQRMIALIDPANAAVGDAVYSQEALDRIISNLMENNSSSNAAPPATDEALAKLDRKPVSKEMLAQETKTECSICIDDLVEGDMALFLPCKHWFHEKCVVMWLKEHNTCPICRTPIEKRESGAGGSNDSNTGSRSANTSFNDPGSSSQAPNAGVRTYLSWLGGGGPSSSNIGTPTGHASGQSPIPSPSARPPSQSQSRLNEAMRSISARQTAQRDRDRDTGSSTSLSFDTSSMQRRNSMSPTSSRAFPASSSRIRQRSPSRGSGNWATADEESASQSARSGGDGGSGGPLSWIRGRLGGNGPSRDARPS
ncbi:uncharacterized protein F5Z01DRAFT_672468 [Emericellopsis atlantica]|uniref:RING-type E3 ubiquitin transferase n=1 Tax=Emericellopsis atlantica TaxID=2614577 RepID=A0A9P8CT63_9HYPO|nr:uncharacterized protein F5Z01DRAFT_672468 [Emericellopsis atlantica]KAG9256486.1 hypothetical protein F5Z01DRAFT_672468 [Emericellopsis atlantica]